MYAYKWNKKTGGYTLTTQTGKYIASEIRPVFAPELILIGFDEHFTFNHHETRPILWAKQNVYIYMGEEVAKLEKTQYGQPLTRTYLVPPQKLVPVNIEMMLSEKMNRSIITALIADTLKRLKEIYDQYIQKSDIAYIGFSGGKDSVVLLDLCHRVLPLSVPVVFSDTDMELPDTYQMWEDIQKRYPDRTFLKAKAKEQALENWKEFGPPSRTIRWCCSIHKSTPAILLLQKRLKQKSIRATAFLGVRGEESLGRADYNDIGEAVKSASQINAYPILSWGAHELWIYTFLEELLINEAYKKGLPRVGCVLCPEASGKYAWFVDAIYPKAIIPYNNAILNAIDKDFKSKEDEISYLSTAGWQARKSGEILRVQLRKPEERSNDLTLSWVIHEKFLNSAFEWFKTIGRISKNESEWILTYKRGKPLQQYHVIITVNAESDNFRTISAVFESTAEIKSYAKFFRNTLNKAIACVGCHSCEVECSMGALSFFSSGKIQIDSVKCINCLSCHSLDYGCWRFKSMYVSEGPQTELSKINKYANFGMRRDWISILVEQREQFSQTTQLGTKMIPAARAWFRQALLIAEKTTQPKKLLKVAERFGDSYESFWDALWIGLVNHAPLIKWYVVSTNLSNKYDIETLFTLMGSSIKDATKNGGLSALKDMITKSPFGLSDTPIVQLEMKGARVLSLTRKIHSVDSLVLLYGLYVMGDLASESSFSVSQMMNASFDSTYISPLVAFGMPVTEFKAQCQGLASKYPDFIQCNFTLGLDEIRIKRDQKSLDDVVELMLNV